MIAAVLRVQEFRTIGKIGGSVVAVLLTTTMIAALTGILLASVFGLNAADLTSGVQEMETAQTLPAKTEQVAALSIPALLVSFVPSNIFVDLAEGRSTSIIAVVMFGLLFGIAALMAGHDDSIHGKRIQDFVDTLQAVIMKLVKLVISMTPYGVLALMTRVISGSDGQAILTLISFVLASYLAILLMFGVHAVFADVVDFHRQESAGVYMERDAGALDAGYSKSREEVLREVQPCGWRGDGAGLVGEECLVVGGVAGIRCALRDYVGRDRHVSSGFDGGIEVRI
jgi:L-cystine uptake protein TcyP (sodium:dicarboxylate symporter family)